MPSDKRTKDLSHIPIAQVLRPGQSQTTENVQGFWFSALRPITPQAPKEVRPRAWPFVPGFNMIFTPRGEAEGRIPFELLREAYDNWDLMHAVIETVVDRIASIPWQIRKKNPIGNKPGITVSTRKADDPTADKLNKMFQRPDSIHNYHQWVRLLLHDMYIYDAATIYKERDTKTNEIVSLIPLDGSTIKCIIDDMGRRPDPPEVAYQQVLYGLPAIDLTTDDLLYAPRNLFNRSPYGQSHVEQILTFVNLGIRRTDFQLAYFTEGTTPEMLLMMTPDVPMSKIEEWQSWMDSELSGNLGERRKMKMVPGLSADGKSQVIFPKEPLLHEANDLDEWLARVVCFTFGLPPTAFIRQMNRATSETSQDTSEEEGQTPIVHWLQDTINECLFAMGYGEDYEFICQIRREQDSKKQADVDIAYLKTGVVTINEVRDDLGLDPYDMEIADTPLMETPNGPIKLDDAGTNPGVAPEGGTPPSSASPQSGGGAPPAKPPKPAVGKRRVIQHPTAVAAQHAVASKLKQRFATMQQQILDEVAQRQPKVEPFAVVEVGSPVYRKMSKAAKTQILYVARHGMTPLDEEKRSAGDIDESLTPDGIASAEKLRDRLKGVPLTAINSSDLNRAKETAAIVAQPHNIKPEAHPELRPLDMGSAAGKSRVETRPMVEHALANPDEKLPGSSESINDFRARVRPELERYIADAKKGKGPRLLVVHGSVIDELGAMHSGDTEEFAVKPGGLLAIYPTGKGAFDGSALIGEKPSESEEDDRRS